MKKRAEKYSPITPLQLPKTEDFLREVGVRIHLHCYKFAGVLRVSFLQPDNSLVSIPQTGVSLRNGHWVNRMANVES